MLVFASGSFVKALNSKSIGKIVRIVIRFFLNTSLMCVCAQASGCMLVEGIA